MTSYLCCIHCNREHKLGDIFVAYLNEEGTIVVTSCIGCGPVNNKKEKDGTGWVVLERTLDGYDIKTEDSIER